LNPDNQPIEDGQLEMLWEDIKQKFKERDDASLANRIFALTKEVDFLQAKYNLIHLCVQQLRFAQNEEVLKIIKNLDYRISDENYLEDLEKAEKYSDGILANIEIIKAQLPKQNIEETQSEETTIHDVLASYAVILGHYIGEHNKIVCPEFIALKKQVSKKVKHQEQELLKLKAKKNGR